MLFLIRLAWEASETQFAYLTRGSARFAQDPDQLEARLGSLFGVQITAARESGSTWGSLGAGRTSPMLGSAELGARFGAKLEIGWGLRDS